MHSNYDDVIKKH